MLEFYPQVKWAHVAAVIASGSLFLLRGLLAQAGAQSTAGRLAMLAPVRYLSYGVDTVLLTAALMLVTVLHQYPFVQAWLTVKVCLLVVYVALGSMALKRGGTQRMRLYCFLAALAVYLFIASVARAHDPRGIFALLG